MKSLRIDVYFLSLKGIQTEDSVTTGFGRGFAFAAGFPVAPEALDYSLHKPATAP